MVASQKSRLLKGSASNLIRMLLSMAVSLLLPPFLVHRMPPTELSAWVLILQLSAYVTYLDLGVQTAIGKFVAEYDARGDRDAARKMVSTAFSMLSIASMLGFLVVVVLTAMVPRLFAQMPHALFHEVRVGLFWVGVSVCFMLPLSVFMTAFTGLQQYGFPTVFLGASRVLSAVALVVVILLHGSLVQMAWTMALFNIATGLAQVYGWKLYASDRVPFTPMYFDRTCFHRLLEYCGVLSIWTVAMLLVSGLDTTIIAHFDYSNTVYYAYAASATNFMLVLSSNILSPLLPAIASLQVQRTPAQLGDLLVRTTRFGVATLLVLGLPLMIGGYPLLTLWLGRAYAAKCVFFLEVLVAGNILRQLSYPYALFIVATGRQRYATVAPVLEAVVNIALSIALARHYGAIGVALGTLIASFVGLAGHILISMRYTQAAISIRRLRFVLQGVLRPALSVLPTLLILPFWNRFNLWPANPAILSAWLLTTLAILWSVGITPAEREQVLRRFSRLRPQGAR